jgi:hypothetical protein
MLAQSFKSADELGITEPQRDALCKTLVLLETGKLRHVPATEVEPDFEHYKSDYLNTIFNMVVSYGIAHGCGTVGCIRGTAERVGHVEFKIFGLPRGLEDLFYNGRAITADPTTAQAATALRSYLTTGDAKWHEAVA